MKYTTNFLNYDETKIIVVRYHSFHTFAIKTQLLMVVGGYGGWKKNNDQKPKINQCEK